MRCSIFKIDYCQLIDMAFFTKHIVADIMKKII